MGYAALPLECLTEIFRGLEWDADGPAVSLVCRSWWAAFRQTVLQAPGLHLAVRPLLSSNQAAALNAFLASQGAQSIYGANPGTYGHSVASVRPDLASLDDACLRRLAKRGLVMQLAVPVPEGAALAGVQAYNTPAVSDAVGLVPAWPRGRFPRTLFGLWVRPTGEALLQSATEQGVAILLRLGPLLQLVGHSEMHVNQRVLVRPCYQEGHWVQLTYADLVAPLCALSGDPALLVVPRAAPQVPPFLYLLNLRRCSLAIGSPLMLPDTAVRAALHIHGLSAPESLLKSHGARRLLVCGTGMSLEEHLQLLATGTKAGYWWLTRHAALLRPPYDCALGAATTLQQHLDSGGAASPFTRRACAALLRHCSRTAHIETVRRSICGDPAVFQGMAEEAGRGLHYPFHNFRGGGYTHSHLPQRRAVNDAATELVAAVESGSPQAIERAVLLLAAAVLFVSWGFSLNAYVLLGLQGDCDLLQVAPALLPCGMLGAAVTRSSEIARAAMRPVPADLQLAFSGMLSCMLLNWDDNVHMGMGIELAEVVLGYFGLEVRERWRSVPDRPALGPEAIVAFYNAMFHFTKALERQKLRGADPLLRIDGRPPADLLKPLLTDPALFGGQKPAAGVGEFLSNLIATACAESGGVSKEAVSAALTRVLASGVAAQDVPSPAMRPEATAFVLPPELHSLRDWQRELEAATSAGPSAGAGGSGMKRSASLGGAGGGMKHSASLGGAGGGMKRSASLGGAGGSGMKRSASLGGAGGSGMKRSASQGGAGGSGMKRSASLGGAGGSGMKRSASLGGAGGSGMKHSASLGGAGGSGMKHSAKMQKAEPGPVRSGSHPAAEGEDAGLSDPDDESAAADAATSAPLLTTAVSPAVAAQIRAAATPPPPGYAPLYAQQQQQMEREARQAAAAAQLTQVGSSGRQVWSRLGGLGSGPRGGPRGGGGRGPGGRDGGGSPTAGRS